MDMATKTINRLDDKTEMYQLTEKQRAVVNALAEHPDEGPSKIAEIASEALDNDTVSRSYVHPIKQKYADLVEQQREIKDNARTEGKEETTGDPFESLEETLGDSTEWQMLSERPHKGTNGNVSNHTESEAKTLQTSLRRTDVEALLGGDVPEELRRELLVKIVAQAFE